MLTGATGIVGADDDASGPTPVGCTDSGLDPIVWGTGAQSTSPIYEEAGSALAPARHHSRWATDRTRTRRCPAPRGALTFLASDGRDGPDPCTIKSKTQAEWGPDVAPSASPWPGTYS